MKIKKKHIGLLISGILLIVVFSTQFISNLWGILIGNGYIIPNQSSIFTFESTKMNKGSGDYWLYGEDRKYYYTTLEKDHIEPYVLISKEEARSIFDFDKTNYETWWNLKVPCID